MKLSSERREQAAAWFSAQRRSVMSIEERADFDAWRADPENHAALNAMHELWGEMASLKEAKPALKLPDRRSRAPFAAIAAGGGAIAAAALLAFSFQPMAFAQSAHTGVGEQRTQTLPDGSVVNLNVVTRVDYKMGSDRRDVRLREGQALFVVHKDAARPFLVRAGAYEVRAVGTAFDVRQRDGVTEVAVQEGVVQVRAVDGPRAGKVIARLAAGQKLVLDDAPAATAPVAKPEPVQVQSVAEWRLRTVTYEDASVAEVVEDLNRFFERPIQIGDPALAARRVTLRLQVADRENTLQTLGALLGAPVVREDRADILGSTRAG